MMNLIMLLDIPLTVRGALPISDSDGCDGG